MLPSMPYVVMMLLKKVTADCMEDVLVGPMQTTCNLLGNWNVRICFSAIDSYSSADMVQEPSVTRITLTRGHEDPHSSITRSLTPMMAFRMLVLS